MTTNATIAKRLKQARLESNTMRREIDQTLFAARGKSWHLENTAKRIPAIDLYKLSKFYNKPMEWFLGEEK